MIVGASNPFVIPAITDDDPDTVMSRQEAVQQPVGHDFIFPLAAYFAARDSRPYSRKSFVRYNHVLSIFGQIP